MRRVALASALLLACEAAPTPSGEPSVPPPEHAAQPSTPPPADPAAEQSTSGPVTAPALHPAAPSLCVRMCETQGQARAVSAEVMAHECVTRCETPSDSPCSASQARARVESVPMNRRASKVWSELANPSFYCGYQDAFTRGLRAAATPDLASRNEALKSALAIDPYALDSCPSGTEVPLAGTAADAITTCGLAEPYAAWDQDVDAASYMALRAVRVRLEAMGLYAGDRKIMLDTLLLATALEHESKR